MKLNSEYIKSSIKTLRNEYNHTHYAPDKDLIVVKFYFLKSLDEPSPKNIEEALRTLQKYKKIYPNEENKKLLKFFIDYGIFHHLKEVSTFYSGENKNLVSYIWHSLGCYAKAALYDYGILVSIVGLAAAPVLMTSAIISGYIDFDTRKPLGSDDQLKLFRNLENITEKNDQKKVILQIVDKYTARGFSFSSQSSKKLIQDLSPESSLSPSKKWAALLYYVVDIEKNNGKALFLIIDEVAKNYLSNKFGFENLKFFQSNQQLPTELIHKIKKNYIQLKQQDQDVSENMQSNLIPKNI